METHTDVHFFVYDGKHELPLIEMSLPSVPVLDQTMYFTFAEVGKGLIKKKYKVIRCDWSIMIINREPPSKHLEVCLSELER